MSSNISIESKPTSWTKLFRFFQVAQSYLATHTEDTKLRYALNRVMPQITKAQAKITEKFEEIDVDHCATDDKGIVLKDAQGGFQFTKDELKKRNTERNKACEADEFEFTPYFATTIPDDLGEIELDAFAEIVISDKKVNEIRAKREGGDGEASEVLSEQPASS